MENLKTYEGFFFKERQHNNVAERILQYVIKNNIIAIQYNDEYRFQIKGENQPKDADPFGEETPKNIIEIKVGEDIYERRWVKLNDDPLDCSNRLKVKIYKALEDNIKNVKEIEKNKRIKDNLDKLKF